MSTLLIEPKDLTAQPGSDQLEDDVRRIAWLLQDINDDAQHLYFTLSDGSISPESLEKLKGTVDAIAATAIAFATSLRTLESKE